MKIILASTSPRRKELLSLLGVDFECKSENILEDMTERLNFKKLAKKLSKQKAEAVFNKTTGDRIVIGSDTMVRLGKKLLGKPKDKTDAKNMLISLSNKTHKVVTGLCVLVEKNNCKKEYLYADVTTVKFKKLTEEEIEKYLSTKEYVDKAGSYAIQGKAIGF